MYIPKGMRIKYMLFHSSSFKHSCSIYKVKHNFPNILGNDYFCKMHSIHPFM